MGDVAQGQESVSYNERFGLYTARVNPFGRTCSGVAANREEAIERAYARAEELKERAA
jgi:hypothetical protein